MKGIHVSWSIHRTLNAFAQHIQHDWYQIEEKCSISECKRKTTNPLRSTSASALPYILPPATNRRRFVYMYILLSVLFKIYWHRAITKSHMLILEWIDPLFTEWIPQCRISHFGFQNFEQNAALSGIVLKERIVKCASSIRTANKATLLVT